MLEIDGMYVQVQPAPVRNLYLTVQPPNATVNVRAPYGVSSDYIISFVQKKRRWIEEKRAIIQQNPFCKPKQYIEGESHLIFGTKHRLHFELSNSCASVYGVNGTLVFCCNQLPQRDCAQLLSLYLLDELRNLLNTLFPIWVNITQVAIHGFNICSMKRLWGSCHIKKRNITINSMLVHYPVSCIEYVVVHELVHLFERSHNRYFYHLLEQYLPLWYEQHCFLRKYPIGTYQ